MNWRSYTNQVLDHTADFLRRRLVPVQEEVLSALSNRLTKPDRDTVENIRPTRDEQILPLLFKGFSEIDIALGALRDIELYVSRFPYTRRGIPRSRYLAYHYESYMHELYLLRERVKRHLTQVERMYRRDRNGTAIQRLLTECIERFGRAVKVVVDQRGGHVHVKRFKHKEIDQLHLIELADPDNRIVPRRDLNRLFRLLTKQIRGELSQQSDCVVQALDEVGTTLSKVVLKSNRTIRYPCQQGAGKGVSNHCCDEL